MEQESQEQKQLEFKPKTLKEIAKLIKVNINPVMGSGF